MAKLTPEQEKLIQQMKEEFNGCPLFAERTKGSLDDLTEKELTIEDIYPLEDYHVIVFEELPDTFYLTGGALKDLCNRYEKELVIGRVIKVKPLKETKTKNRSFRPIEVIS